MPFKNNVEVQQLARTAARTRNTTQKMLQLLQQHFHSLQNFLIKHGPGDRPGKWTLYSEVMTAKALALRISRKSTVSILSSASLTEKITRIPKRSETIHHTYDPTRSKLQFQYVKIISPVLAVANLSLSQFSCCNIDDVITRGWLPRMQPLSDYHNKTINGYSVIDRPPDVPTFSLFVVYS